MISLFKQEPRASRELYEHVLDTAPHWQWEVIEAEKESFSEPDLYFLKQYTPYDVYMHYYEDSKVGSKLSSYVETLKEGVQKLFEARH